MPGFKPGIDQLLPDLRELLQPGTKQVDTLPAGDFAVELITFGDLPDGDQPVGSHFPGSHARHDGVSTVFLDVGKIAVIGVLQRQMGRFQQVFIPAGGQYRSHQRLTDFAPVALPVAADELFKGMDAVDAHQVVNLLTRVREVLADILFHLHALGCQLEFHHLFHQRAASATAGGRFGALFYRPDVGRAVAHRLADIAFADVMAGADLRALRQGRDPQRFRRAACHRRQDQGLGILRQGNIVKHHLHQGRVFTGIPHQHPAEQGFAVGADHDLFVDLLRAVGPLVALRPRRAGVGIAERGHVHPQQFEFGAHVCPGEGIRLSGQGGRGYPGHLIAWCHQAVDFPFPQGALADGENVLIGGATVVVDGDPAALAQHQTAAPGQRVLRADPGRKDHHVGGQLAAIGKTQHLARPGINDLRGGFADMYPHAEGFDFAPQHGSAVVIELHRHQVRGELHHVGLQPKLFQGVGCLQPQQPAADHHPGT